MKCICFSFSAWPSHNFKHWFGQFMMLTDDRNYTLINEKIA